MKDNTNEILKEKPYYYGYDTVKDIIVDCLKEEGLISEENIDEADCEAYFEEHFVVYKSHEEFVIEVSLPILEDKIINTFITPKTTPSFLIEALIDDFFSQSDLVNMYFRITFLEITCKLKLKMDIM